MFRSLMKFVFWIFLLVGGLFMGLSGWILYQPDVDDFWFLSYAYSFFGLMMLFASCLVAKSYIIGRT